MPIRFEKTVRLRDSREVLIRHAGPDEIGVMADLRERVASEGRFSKNLRYPDRTTLEQAMRAELPEPESNAGVELIAMPAAARVATPPLRVVADVLIARRRDDLLAHTAEMHLALHPDWHGVGLGSAMLRAALRWARIHHVEKVDIAVRAQNSAIRALLGTFGFVPDGRRRAHIKTPEGYEDLFLYALFLKPTT